MIDHVGIKATSFDKSQRFYDAALAPLGIAHVEEEVAEENGGNREIGYGAQEAVFFWLAEDRQAPASTGLRWKGVHVAFQAETRAAVDAFYKAAIAAGAADNGAPGPRPIYGPHYYAAFVIDPDGVNVEAVCQKPEGSNDEDA